MLDDLVCPVSNVRVDRNAVRVTGFVTTLLLLLYVWTRSPLIAVPLGLDYALRAVMSAPPSPVARLGQAVARALGLPRRPMDKAPKVFASRIGVCFAMGVAITHFAAPAVAPWLAGVLAVFTALESIGDLCVGCVVYTYVALPLYRAREAISRVPLFADLEEQMLPDLIDAFEPVRFEAGAVLLREGEHGDTMFVVQSGQVGTFRTGPDGMEVPLHTYGPRAFFGEMSLLTGAPRVASARALGPVSALRLSRADVERAMEKHTRMRSILERTAAAHAAEDAAAAGA